MTNVRLLLPSLMLGSSLLLPAQVWAEVGDAGGTVALAQAPMGSGALTTISGALSSGDADLYLIQINSPGAFTATTVGGSAIDTQLFLFRADGLGVTFNDDSVGFQSTITGTFVAMPGKYVLAVSSYDFDPQAVGDQIWLDTPYGTERAPDGPRRLNPVDGWAGTSFASGAYSIALTGASYPSREAVMPDYVHLCESQTQLSNAGVTTWWRSTAGRFQVLYEASHLTGVAGGVTGPIAINALKFRAEDGEPNVGGYTWTGVTVEVGSTSLSAAAMSTTFATNRLAATTTMGPLGTATVTMMRSLGTTPNNYNIVIDLAAIGAAYTHDPTGAQPNLLIDIKMPTAPTAPSTAGAIVSMQDSIGTAAVVRGRGMTTATAAAATGTSSATPIVVAIDYTGATGNWNVIPARNEHYGAACGASPSTFYQTFLQGQDFDLTGLTLTPDNVAAPTTYVVTGSAGAFDPTKVGGAPLSTGDDDVLAAQALGFTHAYPGGTTTQIRPCMNGYVWMDPTMSIGDFSPSIAELLGTSSTLTVRHCPCWFDLHGGRNLVTHPNSGLHVFSDTSGGPGNTVCYVTWLNVGVFNSVTTTTAGNHAVVNLQCVIHEATGVVEYRYGSMVNSHGSVAEPMIVGFTRGRIAGIGSVDPQTRDLSIETPFTTSIEVAGANNMGQKAVATPKAGGTHYSGRMFPGQTIKWNANNVPAGSFFGAQLIDFGSSRPGFSLPILRPGCVLSTSANPVVFEVVASPGASVLGTATFLVPAGYSGLDVFAQYVVLDAGNMVVTSNALRHTIGID